MQKKLFITFNQMVLDRLIFGIVKNAYLKLLSISQNRSWYQVFVIYRFLEYP
jgi:hypothetical protein